MIKDDNLLKWTAPDIRQVKTDDKTGFYAAFMFLVWPLLAVVSAFWNYRSSWGKNILWAFVAFYGFSFAIGAESQGSDIVGYAAEVEYLHTVEMTFSDAIDYYRQRGEIDILRTFIAVTLSRLTGSQPVLTLVYGIIFGFFFSRNIWYVLSHLKGKIKPITMLLLLCFFLVVPFWLITTFRMWTATHIFMYGLLPFLFEGRRRRAFIASLAILVHFSFLVPVGILFTYMLLGNRMTLYFGFFLATFFISEIDLTVFNNAIENYAPEIIQERTAGYRGEDKVESYREDVGGSTRVWYAIWYGRALKWSIMGFLVVLFLKGRDFFTKNRGWLRLLSYTLLFYGVANLFSSLPSGGRFASVANLCALSVIILYVQNREHEVVMKRFIIAALPALLLFVIVSIRMSLYSLSATSVLGNPFIALFLYGDYISLNDVLKMIL